MRFAPDLATNSALTLYQSSRVLRFEELAMSSNFSRWFWTLAQWRRGTRLKCLGVHSYCGYTADSVPYTESLYLERTWNSSVLTKISKRKTFENYAKFHALRRFVKMSTKLFELTHFDKSPEAPTEISSALLTWYHSSNVVMASFLAKVTQVSRWFVRLSQKPCWRCALPH